MFVPKEILAFYEAVTGIAALKNQQTILQGRLEAVYLEKTEMLDKIQANNDLIYQLQKTDEGKAQKIIEDEQKITALQNQNDFLNSQVADANGNIESLKTQLAMTGDITAPTPAFIDESKPPYLPYMQVLELQGKINGYRLKNPRDMYVIFDCIKKIVNDKGWRKLSKAKKLMAVWNFILDPAIRKYAYDYGDNWQLALQTLVRMLGDCEDSSVLFVTICRAVGIRPDEVFLAVGPTSFGYHAYPIAHLSAEEGMEFTPNFTAGWYIFESTINGIAVRPKALKGSEYNIDDGIQNWKFAGQLKPEFYSDFNGVPSGTAGPEPVIENSETKKRLLENYWKEEIVRTQTN